MITIVVFVVTLLILVFIRNRLIKKNRNIRLNEQLSRSGKERAVNFDHARSNADKIEPDAAERILSWSFEELRRAIPFVHTNVPQSLVSYGCSNPVYGSTTNPYNSERVPGGSSGGEAALIATGGSVLGIGSDVGGSIRIPSTFCGIAGFKSSSTRFSHTFSSSSVPGRQLVTANEGPMAKSINTCIEYLKM
ncbi:hypothetical protein TELCIR_19277, partial [Teladorsagia circumcincta]